MPAASKPRLAGAWTTGRSGSYAWHALVEAGDLGAWGKGRTREEAIDDALQIHRRAWAPDRWQLMLPWTEKRPGD